MPYQNDVKHRSWCKVEFIIIFLKLLFSQNAKIVNELGLDFHAKMRKISNIFVLAAQSCSESKYFFIQ